MAEKPDKPKGDADEERQAESLGTGEAQRPEPDKDVAADVAADSSATQMAEQGAEDTTPFDDEKTAQAIEDIVATESDELLEAEDAAAARLKTPERKRGFFGRWWHSSWARWLTFLLVFGSVGAAFAVPAARYWLLNALGVHSSASVIVVDATTQLPLKGVEVAIGGRKAQTNADGQAKITGLRLGPQQLAIAQVGFAEVRQRVTIGWGSNPLGTFALRAVGVQYQVEVRDYLSDQPVEGVRASSGVASAVSDKAGKITLTLESIADAKEPVTLTKGGYRTEQVTLQADPKMPTKVTLVLARKTVFVTKQSGKFDVYKSDIDGQNRQVLLPGTGTETNNITLVSSADGNRAALVSTRTNQRDTDGSPLSALTLIDIATGETVTIAQAPHIRLIDWLGPRLIFEQVGSDATANNRHQIISYNYTDNTRLQLAAAKELGAALSAQGAVYYVVAPDPANTSLKPGLFKINPDGGGKQTALDAEIWSVLRPDYSTLYMQTPDQWYSYSLSGGGNTKIATPGSLATRHYIDNADHSKSLWVVSGTLRSYEVATAKEATVHTQSGLVYPVQWMSDSVVVYRLASGSEIADYAVNLAGGTPHKISDVSATFGFTTAQ
jgi:hypothetical protein